MPEQMHPGCWIDGTWGWRATARLVEIAEAYGMPVDPAVKEQGVYNFLEDSDEFETVVELADAAEVWLNENVAPDGLMFGWSDGEFMLWPVEDWESA